MDNILKFRRPESHFTPISNALLRDSSLSHSARFLISLMMTYAPDDVPDVETLQGIAGWGRDKAYSVTAELIKRGLVDRVQRRASSGRITGNEYRVTEAAYAWGGCK